MTSTDEQALKKVVARVRSVYGSWRKDTSVTQMREDWDALFAPREPIDLSFFQLNGVDVAWVNAPAVDTGRTLIYFHGGGFKVGSVKSHCELMWYLSRAANCQVLAVDYRLAPEHPHPAALEDALAVYKALVASGKSPSSIALAGDSAGGNLVLNLLLRLRDSGEPLPAGALLMSAWTDLAATGDSYDTRANKDPIHQRPMIQKMAASYLGNDIAANDPKVSPLYAELSNLPPMFLQVGDAETVLDDSREFAARALQEGCQVGISVYPKMIHVFQQFMHDLPEARKAIEEGAEFLRDCWDCTKS